MPNISNVIFKYDAVQDRFSVGEPKRLFQFDPGYTPVISLNILDLMRNRQTVNTKQQQIQSGPVPIGESFQYRIPV